MYFIYSYLLVTSMRIFLVPSKGSWPPSTPWPSSPQYLFLWQIPVQYIKHTILSYKDSQDQIPPHDIVIATQLSLFIWPLENWLIWARYCDKDWRKRFKINPDIMCSSVKKFTWKFRIKNENLRRLCYFSRLLRAPPQVLWRLFIRVFGSQILI